MPQIAECFLRSVEITDLSESVHAKWKHVGSYRLEMGVAIIDAVVEAVQSQVISEHLNVYPCLIWCLQARGRLAYDGFEGTKSWMISNRNQIFNPSNPIYNGGTESRSASRCLLPDFGDGIILEEDSHREDRPSVSADLVGNRRTITTEFGTRTVRPVMSVPKTEEWTRRLLKAQTESMFITQKPSTGVGGQFCFEVFRQISRNNVFTKFMQLTGSEFFGHIRRLYLH